MPFYESGDVRIHYEEIGSGFPLLLIPGGGLNSNMRAWTSSYGPFDAMNEFKDHFRCITMDQRNANGGESTGPLRMDSPWDGYADDHCPLRHGFPTSSMGPTAGHGGGTLRPKRVYGCRHFPEGGQPLPSCC